MKTPAQAYGHPRFTDDYPWDGGYGEGERRSACRNAKEITAQRPGGSCSGLLPSWITNYPSGMLSYNGKPVPGYGVGQAPDVFSMLTPEQKAWVQTTLGTLNTKILATSKPCATWADPNTNLAPAVACFQSWANSLQVPLTSGGALRTDGVIDQQALRTDGVIDQPTLTALLALATQIHPEDFPTPFPATPATNPLQSVANAVAAAALAVSPTPVATSTAPASRTEKHEGLSTGAKVAIGVASVTAVGTAVYFIARSSGGKKKRRRGRR